jgi:hypothetical protein
MVAVISIKTRNFPFNFSMKQNSSKAFDDNLGKKDKKGKVVPLLN